MTTRLAWRARVAVGCVVTVNYFSRRLGRGAGTVAGGRVGLALEPRLLRALTRSRTVVLVSGTNGKTTTSALLRAGWGDDVAGNVTGANMPAGHVAALATSRAARVVLETDEAWLPSVLADADPAVVVLLNLSRDQLDRANEVRQLAQRWRDCLAAPQFTGVVVANSNDPLVVFAAQASERVRWVDVPTPWRGDAASCPHCTRALDFADRGWSCACGFAQPTPPTATLREELHFSSQSFRLDLAVPGMFNEVNAALATVALVELGQDPGEALARMRRLDTIQGRYGLRRFGERTVRLMLAKNPAGATALLESLSEGEVWIAINAQIADGKDPSWLYDVPFGVLRGRRVRCLGERRLDLATRLTYAGVQCEVSDDVDALRRGTDDVTVVANYTAFREWLARTAPC